MQKQDKDLSDICFDDWVEHILPRPWHSYARLCRVDRSTGIWLALLPSVAALIQASRGAWPTLTKLLVFSSGAFFMRCIGCTINDICDRNFDRYVERTRFRPLASAKIRLKGAIYFLLVQLLVCSLLLLFINKMSKYLALVLMPIVFLYPLCKRLTYWPQAILGICFNWGMLIAWSDTCGRVPLPAILMWLGTVFWQIGYDSIYAYVDAKDDYLIGIYSTATLFANKGVVWIAIFYGIASLLWVSGGYFVGMNTIYYVFIAVLALQLCWQLKRFNPKHPYRNFNLFRTNVKVAALLALAAVLGNFRF